MQFSAHIIAVLALSLSAIAQTTYPACVTSCISSNPTASMCNGDETGSALDKCTCASLQGSSMIKCIQSCPTSDQSQYAAGLPALCRSQLFPGVTPASTSASGGSGSASTQSGSSPAATTTPAQSSPTKTGQASPSTSSPGAAAVHEISALLAAGGLLAAMMM